MAVLPATGPDSDRVAHATGVISVQAGCTLPEAFDLLRARAVKVGQTLEHTALDVIDHIIRFESGDSS
jgi:AmiR/NasT family two-component response regulator